MRDLSAAQQETAGRPDRFRWPELDGLRGIAILLVIGRHAATQPGHDAVTWLQAVMANGWIGVDLFFVLSGFLVAEILIGSQGKPSSLSTYARARVFRILPAYLVVLLGCVVAGWMGLREPVAAESFLVHILFLQDYFPSHISPVLWSLGVEWKFYVIAPLLVLVGLRTRPVYACIALALAVVAGMLLRGLAYSELGPAPDYVAFHFGVRSPMHHCLEPLLFGVTVAFIRSRELFGFGKVPLAAAGCAVIGVHLLSGELVATPSWYDATVQPAVLAAGFALLVASAVNHGRPIRALRASPLRFLARISYSLYLVHLFFVPGARRVATDLLGPAGQPDATILLTLIMVLACSIPLAALMYRWVERPAIEFARTATRRAQAPATLLPTG